MAQMERPSHRTAAKTVSKKLGNWNMEKAWYPLAFCKVKGKRKIGQYQSCKRGQLNSCGQSSCKCTRMLQLVKATLTCDFNSAPVVSFPDMGEEDCNIPLKHLRDPLSRPVGVDKRNGLNLQSLRTSQSRSSLIDTLARAPFLRIRFLGIPISIHFPRPIRKKDVDPKGQD